MRKYRFEQHFYEEAQTLIGVFNMMVMQLRKQINVIKEKARTEAALHEKELENMRIVTLLKTSELKALQMQMNPHFLFNTLNMIARTADFGDTDRTSVLLQKTAQLLRYNLDCSGKMVSLANEIEMLGNYVYLQEHVLAPRYFLILIWMRGFIRFRFRVLFCSPLWRMQLFMALTGKLSNRIRTMNIYHQKNGERLSSALPMMQRSTGEISI